MADQMQDLKNNVEELARQTGQSAIDVISQLQTGASFSGDDAMLDALCELKWEYIA